MNTIFDKKIQKVFSSLFNRQVVDLKDFTKGWRAGTVNQANRPTQKKYVLDKFPPALVMSICGMKGTKEKVSLIKSVGYLDENDVLDLIISFQRINEKFPPDYVDLAILWCLVSQLNPQNILEIGSGYSTIIFGEYFRHKVEKVKNKPLLTSLEMSADFAELVQHFLLENNIPNASLIKVNSKSEFFQNIPTEIFDISLNETFDFIYLDSAPNGSVTLGADFILMNKHILKVGTVIVIDGRKNAVKTFYESDIEFDFIENDFGEMLLASDIDKNLLQLFSTMAGDFLSTNTTIIQVTKL